MPFKCYTGWSQSLCAPDDYSTSSGAQRLFDHPVLRQLVYMQDILDSFTSLPHAHSFLSVQTQKKFEMWWTDFQGTNIGEAPETGEPFKILI